MEDHIHKVNFEGEFRVCPECGYRDGFHTMLKQDGQDTLWLFICPACHEIFDIGKRV